MLSCIINAKIMRTLECVQFIPLNNLPMKKDHSTNDKSKQFIQPFTFPLKISTFTDVNLADCNR